MLAQLTPGPSEELRPVEPEVLLALGEHRDLGVVLEAQRVPPAGHAEPARDPGVVPQRLVVERGRGDGLLVPVGISRLAVDQPVAKPPRRRVTDEVELLADALPRWQRQAVGEEQAVALGGCEPVEREFSRWRARRFR